MYKPFHILTDRLPDTVTVFGTEYPIHTSFRNWVKIAMLAENKKLRDSEKMAEMLKLCYKEELPPSLPSAILAAELFMKGDAEQSASSPEGTPMFSFVQDADVIYAAFLGKYGIDLTKEDLHWYVFRALLSALSEENPFRTILKIRSTDEKDVKDKKARAVLRSLKKRFSLNRGSEVDVAGSLADLF